MARGDEMRLKNLILILVAVATVFAVAACAQSAGDQGGKENQGQEQKPQEGQVAPDQGAQQDEPKEAAIQPPPNDMMKLTIPKMDKIENDEIPTGLGTDETLFHDYAAVHLKQTGFPWDKEANVYIAGHRLGYENTNSYLAFWDLNEVYKGDQFYIVDSEGRKYTYKVIRKFIANPGNLSVLQPIDGKNVVTLQTCTLPDYTRRLLIRGELQKMEKP